jgi:hypothetical protein
MPHIDTVNPLLQIDIVNNEIAVKTAMRTPILLLLSLLPVAILTPALEIGPTHLFDPAWPGHARLHEAWQLITHIGLAGLCAWLGTARGHYRLAGTISLIINGGFLAAFALAGAYGGTMRHSDGSELAIAGVNAAVIVMVIASAAALGTILMPPAGPQARRL